jgi:phosphoglycerate dehydrogenase-like enzyme
MRSGCRFHPSGLLGSYYWAWRAGIDVTVEESLSPASPLWSKESVLITPNTAGETRRYEDNVLDILQENLERLWRGETSLRNQILGAVEMAGDPDSPALV